MSTSQTTPRPPIPPALEGEVRRRCGFGCVICGLPLYEYEHMLGWANVQRHVAEEITLLCDMHHREKTNGLLPMEEVQAANEAPFNLREGVSKPYNLHYNGPRCETIIGSNKFSMNVGDGPVSIPLVIDGRALILFNSLDNHFLLNLELFDEFNHPILRIANNELQYSVTPWDIRLRGRNLLIRAAERRILVDISFEVPNRIVINRGRLLFNGVEIVLQPDYALIVNDGNLLDQNEVINMPIGLMIGSRDFSGPAAFHIPNVPRYSGSTLAAMRRARRRIRDSDAMRQALFGH